MARMIELKLEGCSHRFMVNPDHIISATEKSEGTCRIELTEYTNGLTVECSFDELKKLLSDENN